MGNVHKHNNCVNIPSSQTFWSFNNFVINQRDIVSRLESQNMEGKKQVKQKQVVNLRLVTNCKTNEVWETTANSIPWKTFHCRSCKRPSWIITPLILKKQPMPRWHVQGWFSYSTGYMFCHWSILANFITSWSSYIPVLARPAFSSVISSEFFCFSQIISDLKILDFSIK